MEIEHGQELIVMTRRYSDNSAHEVVRIYLDSDRANEDLDLVRDDCAWTYELKTATVYGGDE